jgi:hypothetical protein
VLLLLVTTVTVGCSSDPAADGSEPRLTLAFTQVLRDEGTGRGLLRVTNDGRRALHVTGVGLDWSGYGSRFGEGKDVVLSPGQTMDLKLLLPRPRCDAGDERVRGVVETEGGTLVQPLSANGERFLRHLWGGQCASRFVRERLDIGYAGPWRLRGAGAGSRAEGTLRLTRVRGDEPVTLLGTQGSVLYDFALAGATRLRPGETRLDARVAILPGNRCDDHARGQATAPFTFRVRLRVGDAPPMNLLVPPPPAGQAAATAVLDRACGTT